MNTEQVIKNSGLFQKLSHEQLRHLLSFVTEITVPAGVDFIKQGDKADVCYIIKEGQARVYSHDKFGEQVVLARIEAGEYIGEQALLTTIPGLRNASVRAITDLTLIAITHDKFRELIELDKEHKEKLLKLGHKQLIDRLLKLSSTKTISKALFEDHEEYDVEIFQEGQTILTQGEKSDVVYYILDGEIDLFVKENDAQKYICTTFPGDVLGEAGVIQSKTKEVSIPTEPGPDTGKTTLFSV